MLGVDQYNFSCIVIPTLMEKIPDVVRLNMIKGARKQDDLAMDDFLGAFKDKQEIRERNKPIFKEI